MEGINLSEWMPYHTSLSNTFDAGSWFSMSFQYEYILTQET